MDSKPDMTPDTSSEIGSNQPLGGSERETKPGPGGGFAFGVKLAIVVGLVVLAFWLLDRAV